LIVSQNAAGDLDGENAAISAGETVIVPKERCRDAALLIEE